MIFVGSPPLTQHPRQIVVADLNGDGRPDAFIADHGTDLPPFPGYQSTLILSQPHGKLVDATGNLPQEIAFTHSAAAADVDGNGTIDLSSIDLGVASGDLNGDGHPDLVIASTQGNPLYIGANLQVLISNDDGTFNDETATWIPNEPPDSDGWVAFPQLIDLNGDGKLDLVTHEDGYPVPPSPAYINDGNGHFTPFTLPAYTRGMWTFVNDKPHQPARDVLAVSERENVESYIFYRRLT